MISIGRIFIIIGLLWVVVYTISFGTWTWKNKNKLGAIAIFIVALTTLVLPMYSMFFRE